MNKLIVYLDGASRGNPGPAGVGIIISNEEGKIISQINKYVGKTTNNVAEYMALIHALKVAKKYKAKWVRFYLDSELLVNQINGLYRTKNKNLFNLLQQVRKLSNNFSQVEFQYIPREENKLADKLANKAINLAVL
jgi:ribonuclease HI